MAIKSMLTLGKKGFQSLDEIIKGAGSKFAGKGKKVVDLTSESKKKQLDKAKQNRQKRNQVSKKEYEKTLPDVLKKKPGLPSVIKSESIKSNKLKEKSTSLVPTGQSKTIKETVNPKKIKQNFTLQGKPVDKTIKQTNPNKSKKTGTSLVTTPKKTSQNILNKQKESFLKRNKGKIAGGAAVLATIPTLIDTKDSKVGADQTKKTKPSTSIGPDTSKITKPSSTVKVQKQTLPQTKANDYTGKYLDKEGNVAYESFSDFIAHMSGKPKKRAMPEKTKRIIGEGNKLKKITAETKGAGKGVKYKAFKAGTKDKTIGKPMSPKDALKKKFAEATDMNFLMYTLGLKNPTRKRSMVEKIFGGGPDEAYTLKKGRAKIAAKEQSRKDLKKEYPELMKRVTNKSGGGLIAGLYDKPEKVETYKGNTSAGRQVKGYGKARKR